MRWKVALVQSNFTRNWRWRMLLRQDSAWVSQFNWRLLRQSRDIIEKRASMLLWQDGAWLPHTNSFSFKWWRDWVNRDVWMFYGGLGRTRVPTLRMGMRRSQNVCVGTRIPLLSIISYTVEELTVPRGLELRIMRLRWEIWMSRETRSVSETIIFFINLVYLREQRRWQSL